MASRPYLESQTYSASLGGTVYNVSVGFASETDFSGVYNVKSYGAKGDGTTDDTASIQAAINAANTAGGGRVVWPDSGTYMVNVVTELDSGSNITYDLTAGATLKAITNGDDDYRILRLYAVSNVTILGGHFLGERSTHSGGTGEAGMCLSILGSSNVRVIGTSFIDAWGDGIYIGVGSGSTKATNVKITDCFFDNNRRQGCSITHADDVTLTGCTFEGTTGTNPQCGVDVEPNSNQAVTNTKFIGCHFKDNVGDGILLTGTTGTVNDIVIDGCTFTGNASESTSRASIKVFSSSNVTIGLNTIQDSDNQGIRLDTASHCIVNGNTVSNTQRQGIYLKTSTDISVTGNTVHQASLATNNTYYAYQVISSCDNIQISGNTSSVGASGNNQKHGIVVESSTSVNVYNNSLESVSATFLHTGTNSVGDIYGSGTPESTITAPIGFTYRDYDGGAGTTFFVKESGAGNSGWVGK